MLEDLKQARIIITNYHAFKPQQTMEVMEVTSSGKKALAGHGAEPQTVETEDRMVDRVCGDLKGMKDVVVINDEAHHCYRVRPEAEAEERGRSDEAREARENNEIALLWSAGVEAVQRQLGVRTAYDLSATPFFLSGSGSRAGSLFPWVVSDFSLIDAIECGVVKLPRVPVSDNLPNGAQPLYRNLWPAVRDQMPSGTRGGQRLNPQNLPLEVKNALDALYGHYERTFETWHWTQVDVPPVFIVVCANAVASELVYEYMSGYKRTDETTTSSRRISFSLATSPRMATPTRRPEHYSSTASRSRRATKLTTPSVRPPPRKSSASGGPRRHVRGRLPPRSSRMPSSCARP